MEITHSALIELLTKENLEAEIDEVLEISRQGFDVQLTVLEKNVCKMARSIFLQKIANFNREVVLLTDPEEVCSEKTQQLKNQSFSPIVLLNKDALKIEGAGFVTYNTLTTLNLMPSVRDAVNIILKFYHLEVFAAIFDKASLQLMRKFLMEHGISKLIDAGVDIAYKEGVLENQDYLESYLIGIKKSSDITQDQRLSSITLSQTLNWMLEIASEPLLFNKALLSYYCVHILRMSANQAMTALKVTRTTLNSHLSEAKNLHLEKFFSTSVADFQSSK